MYIPPGVQYDFTDRELEALLKQLPKPYMLLGDLNAHNGIWFDKGNLDARGAVIEKVLLNNDCYVLDKDQDTHVYSHNGEPRSSHIDLSICSLGLLMDFEWGCYGVAMGI